MKQKRIPEEVLKMCEHAYSTVPLYMRLRDEMAMPECDFNDLPFVGKDIYMQSQVPYLSTYYVKKYLMGKLDVGKTSGSTGKISTYYWDLDEEKKSLMELWYLRKKYYNVLPTDRLIIFFPIVVEGDLEKRLPNILGLSKEYLYNDRLEEAYNKIMEFQPKWMILQPSVFMMLAQLVKKGDLPIIQSIEYIEFTGEYLEDSVRKLAEELFACKTANQYGMREVNSMAYECPEGNMHVMGSNVYMEVVNEEDGVGDICVTTLQNKAMPYIRYITGDKGKILHTKCTCGNASPILQVCRGRDNDLVSMPDGTKLHPYSLLQVINDANFQLNNCIIQYQLVQKRVDTFVFRLVVQQDTDKGQMEHIIYDAVAKHLNIDFHIEFSYYDQIIPDFKTGKIAAFISNC